MDIPKRIPEHERKCINCKHHTWADGPFSGLDGFNPVMGPLCCRILKRQFRKDEDLTKKSCGHWE